MLKLTSDLLFAERKEFKCSTDLTTSGHEGMWVIPDASQSAGNYAIRPEAADTYCLAYPIWNESFRHEAGMISGLFAGTRGSSGFTGDVAKTGKITTLSGHFRALTDWFTGSPTIGQKLGVTTDGRLVVTSTANAVVAVCVKASHSITYLGQAYTVIEFETV